MSQNSLHCSLRYGFLTALIILFVVLVGCVEVGPDYKSPEIVMPEKWQNTDKQTMKYVDFREWWTLFNDPTLNRLIDVISTKFEFTNCLGTHY